VRAAGGTCFGLQVLEGGTHDGERRADLVGELACERAQVAGVFVEALQQRGEAAGDISQLIARVGLRKSW